jgi:hypothetical protein
MTKSKKPTAKKTTALDVTMDASKVTDKPNYAEHSDGPKPGSNAENQ